MTEPPERMAGPTPIEYWARDTLGALCVSVSLAFSAGILSAIEHDIEFGAELAAKVFAISTPISIVVAYALPPIHKLLAKVDQVIPEKKSPVTQVLPMPDAIIRRRGDPRPAQPQGRAMQYATKQYETTTEQAAIDVQNPRGALAEFYTVLITMYGQPLTMASFKKHFSQNGARYYKTYIGERNSNSGVWKRWKIVEQKDGRGRCGFVEGLGLDDILKKNTRLYAYALKQKYQ